MGLEFLIPFSLPEEKVLTVVIYSTIIFLFVVGVSIYLLRSDYKEKAYSLQVKTHKDLFQDFTPLKVIVKIWWGVLSMIVIKGIVDFFVVTLSAIDHMLAYGLVYAGFTYLAIRLILVQIIRREQKLTPPIFKYRKELNWWGTPKY